MRMRQRSPRFLVRNRASPWRAVCTHRDIRRAGACRRTSFVVLFAESGSNLSQGSGNTLQPGSQRLPGGLSCFAIRCCWSLGRVARLRRWTRVRRRSQGCAKRTSKRLDLYGVGVITLDEGLAISRTLEARASRCRRRGIIVRSSGFVRTSPRCAVTMRPNLRDLLFDPASMERRPPELERIVKQRTTDGQPPDPDRTRLRTEELIRKARQSRRTSTSVLRPLCRGESISRAAGCGDTTR